MSVREGLLALLTAGPKHGYQLRHEFETATAGVWPLNIGQVYTTLERLQRDGLVEAADAAGLADSDAAASGKVGERRRYRLTPHGREELGDWFSAGPDLAPHREPTVIKVLVAMHTTGVDVRQVIDVQRQALLAHLAEQQRARRKAFAEHAEPTEHADGAESSQATDATGPAPPTAATDRLTASMMFDALVTRTEADLRWLDLCDEQLARAGRADALATPPPPLPGAAPSPRRTTSSTKDRS